MRPIRSAIIGGGMITAVHRRAIHAAGGELVGILGSSAARSADLASRWGIDGYDDLDDLLSRSDIDVVHIASPNTTHAEYAVAALRAGKHIVCEKPIAANSDEAAAIAQTATETALVATVPFVYRYHPIVRELRARSLAGQFGRWYMLHGSYLQDWMLSPAAGNWRVDNGGASRAFADIGSHWCDLVEFVTGERFASVTATLSTAIPERPSHSGDSFTLVEAGAASTVVTTEDAAIVTLRTESGVPANVVVSQVAGGRRNRLWFELDGAEGSAVFDQENPETAWLGGPDTDTILSRGKGALSGAQDRVSFLPGGHPQGYQDCFNAFIADTHAAIRGEQVEGLPTVHDGYRSALLVDAVLESDRRQSWTTLHSIAASTAIDLAAI